MASILMSFSVRTPNVNDVTSECCDVMMLRINFHEEPKEVVKLGQKNLNAHVHTGEHVIALCCSGL